MINASAKSYGKLWKLDNWVTIIKYLKNKYNNCYFFSTGTLEESNIYDYLAHKTGVNFHNLCGKTSIRETIAFYRHLDLVITVDSAPAHFAAIADAKNIIIIYGPTNQQQWLPQSNNSKIYQVYLNLSCRPCFTRSCYGQKCLQDLKPENIIKIIDKINI